ncbi:uncharacterized protein LOC34624493 [Cyclospora cayetanensis]|uniref:Uncharacterized protein LOC34624493 n=1 Tax=Cyclospora cayetanensis TaxID=88456 RepID=A0A6P6S408_9EIME|nr:uncharacterized protein LOC34624493 [Cyclospora cayetanensis]
MPAPVAGGASERNAADSTPSGGVSAPQAAGSSASTTSSLLQQQSSPSLGGSAATAAQGTTASATPPAAGNAAAGTDLDVEADVHSLFQRLFSAAVSEAVRGRAACCSIAGAHQLAESRQLAVPPDVAVAALPSECVGLSGVSGDCCFVRPAAAAGVAAAEGKTRAVAAALPLHRVCGQSSGCAPSRIAGACSPRRAPACRHRVPIDAYHWHAR